MKKVLSTMLALGMLLTCVGCDKKSDDSNAGSGSSGKTKLNIWAFTDEVPGMVQKYIDTHARRFWRKV